jgi:hypothetical protein
MTLFKWEFIPVNEHEILQSFRHNSDGSWTPFNTNPWIG